MHPVLLLFAWAAIGKGLPLFQSEYELELETAQNSQPMGLSPTSNSTFTVKTATLSKEVNTTLAGVMLLLTAGTFWFLTRYATILANEIILPAKFLQDNMAAILSLTWRRHGLGLAQEIFDENQVPWVLFYHRKYRGLVPRDNAIGYEDIIKGDVSPKKNAAMSVKTYSPVVKSLVQIAIWNSVSFWLVLVMFVNTLVYSGAVSKNVTNDSPIRLVLVGSYAIANIGHEYYTTKLLYRNFSLLLFQTCWTIICRDFLFLPSTTYALYQKQRGWHHKLLRSTGMDLARYNFELFGTNEHSYTYHASGKRDEIQTGSRYKPWSDLVVQDKQESNFDKHVKPLREADIKAYEKATDSALEKTLANVAILLGICLATGLAPWTSISANNATSAQLGSYALLISISTGILALVSSITLLTNATESAGTLLLYQEKTIAARRFEHEPEDVARKFSLQDVPQLSFSKGIAGESHMTPFSLWWSTSSLLKLPCLLFGSALMLIPRVHGFPKSFTDENIWLFFKVQGAVFACFGSGSHVKDRVLRCKLENDTPGQEEASEEQEYEKSANQEVIQEN